MTADQDGATPALDRYDVVAIDDEPAFLAIIQRVGKNVGLKVGSTTQPDAFKRMVEMHDPEVVFMDLQMPGCDGIELLRFLAEQHSRAHIVLISGFDSRVLRIAAGLGNDLGLKMAEPRNKPIHVSALISILESLKGHRR